MYDFYAASQHPYRYGGSDNARSARKPFYRNSSAAGVTYLFARRKGQSITTSSLYIIQRKVSTFAWYHFKSRTVERLRYISYSLNSIWVSFSDWSGVPPYFAGEKKTTSLTNNFSFLDLRSTKLSHPKFLIGFPQEFVCLKLVKASVLRIVYQTNLEKETLTEKERDRGGGEEWTWRKDRACAQKNLANNFTFTEFERWETKTRCGIKSFILFLTSFIHATKSDAPTGSRVLKRFKKALSVCISAAAKVFYFLLFSYKTACAFFMPPQRSRVIIRHVRLRWLMMKHSKSRKYTRKKMVGNSKNEQQLFFWLILPSTW